jgi:hypothetical protein
MLLHDHASLRLAILNACEGARASRTDPFAGTAQSLVEQGIPAVIAMQFEVPDETAILFAHEFYGAVADGYPVDTALAEARKAIFARGEGLDWGTPVLHMRAPDGRIFDLAGVPRPVSQPPRPAPTSSKINALELEGLEAYYRGDWARAAALYGEILAQQPNRPGAAAKLAAATRNQALEENYAAARQACDASDWPVAVEKLEAVVQMEPTYRDAATLLAETKRQAAMSELYAEARLLAGAGSWEAVVKAFAQMATLNPAPPDPDALLAQARERIAAAERERKLAELYAEALRQLDAGQPAAAARQFEEVLALSPAYRQAEALLARARQESDALREAEARQARLADLYGHATKALDASQWEGALGYLGQITQLAPDYRDVEALAGRARQALAERQAAEKRRAELDALYTQVSSQLRQENWAEAERLCSQILERQPHYRDAETLLAKRRTALRLDALPRNGPPSKPLRCPRRRQPGRAGPRPCRRKSSRGPNPKICLCEMNSRKRTEWISPRSQPNSTSSKPDTMPAASPRLTSGRGCKT